MIQKTYCEKCKMHGWINIDTSRVKYKLEGQLVCEGCGALL